MIKQEPLPAYAAADTASLSSRRLLTPEAVKAVGELLVAAGVVWAIVVIVKAIVAALAQVAAFAFLVALIGGAFR